MKKIFTIMIFLSGSMAAISQDQHYGCTAGEMSQKQYDRDPVLLAAKAQLDSFTAVYIQQHHGQQAQRSGAQYIIPVVFHILHNAGSENIPDSLVYVEMQHWNQYMSMTNPELPSTVPSFVNIIGNTQVEFRLAQRDPKGNCTNGIEHIYTQSTYYGDDNTKLNPWPREKYLNVWLVRGIQKDTTNYGILAYAFYPPAVSTYNNDEIIDGIIAKAFVVGSNDAFSRPTLGHECGHWMNLAHTWGNTNNPNVACGDDDVNDTPITEGDQNTDPVTEARCVPGVVENVQNIMNYAQHHFMFTQGQVARIQAALNSPISGRDSIWSPTNLQATGTDQPLTYPNINSCAAPIAEYAVNNRYVCAGQNIKFTDVSYNAEYQDRSWTFPADASLPSSTDRTVIINFSSSGWKEVSLQVSNVNGSSIKTKTMVYVSDGNVISAPYFESFDDTAEVNANWHVLNYDNNNTAFRWNEAGHHSIGSYRMNMYNAYYDGDKDELISPALDLSGLSGSQRSLSFEYSFATWNANHLGDSLASLSVLASTDCGNTWRSIYFNAGGYNLYNAGAITGGPYVPGETDDYWKKVTLPLPSYLTSNVTFKFQLLSAKAANHFYIENVNIGQAEEPSSISTTASSIDAINIVPNPVTESANLLIDVSATATISAKMYDMAGREISTIYDDIVDAGGKKISFNTERLSTGVYVIKVTDGILLKQRRFVKM